MGQGTQGYSILWVGLYCVPVNKPSVRRDSKSMCLATQYPTTKGALRPEGLGRLWVCRVVIQKNRHIERVYLRIRPFSMPLQVLKMSSTLIKGNKINRLDIGKSEVNYVE